MSGARDFFSQELMPLSQLSRDLATTMQEFTQQGCVLHQRTLNIVTVLPPQCRTRVGYVASLEALTNVGAAAVACGHLVCPC